MRRIELITGERIGTDGGEWVDWWAAHRANFRALRASFPVELHEVSRMVIRYRDKSGAYSIAGFDAPAPRGPEERVLIGATQMADLVAELRGHVAETLAMVNGSWSVWVAFKVTRATFILVEIAAALFSLCGLKAADRFIDLGSSEGGPSA